MYGHTIANTTVAPPSSSSSSNNVTAIIYRHIEFAGGRQVAATVQTEV